MTITLEEMANTRGRLHTELIVMALCGGIADWVVFAVLWSPALHEQEKDKGTMIFSSLLALAAISFTFESSFPGSISLNTPVAQMISLGCLCLVLVLMIEVGLTAACADPTARFHAGCVELRRQIKWALPAMMLIVCAGIAVRALPG